MFCITKDVQTLLCCCSIKTKFPLFLLCFSPKWTFITFSGCNNNYIRYLWLSNVHEMLPSSTFLIISLTHQRKGPGASWVDLWGQTGGGVFLMTPGRCTAAGPHDPETGQRSRSCRDSHVRRRTWGQSHRGWTVARAGLTLRWVGVGVGGSTVADMCLRTVKEQIYMQAALNQTCIPPLTQYTQTHKLAHT